MPRFFPFRPKQAESPLLPLKDDIEPSPTRVPSHISASRSPHQYSTLNGDSEATHQHQHPQPPTSTPKDYRPNSLPSGNIESPPGEANNNSSTTSNNNTNNEGEFYTQLSSSSNPSHKHQHEYQLYPNDTFARLEGKSPRPNTKMQTKVDAVGRITGPWGKWQLRTVLLIFLCKIPSSWFMACIIFTAPAPRHGEFFCKPPNTIGAQNQTQWIKVSHPQKEESDDQEFAIDFCNVYQDAQEHAHHYYNYENSEQEPRVWEKPLHRNSNVIPCTEFQHESDYHSVVTQYDLVCSRDILVSVTQFFHLFGVLTGGILANQLLK